MDPVTICNMALGLFGQSRIVSIAEDQLDSAEAELCFTFFEASVRAVFEEGQPLFATGFFDLGARQDSPYKNTGASLSPGSGTGVAAQVTLQSIRPLVAQFAFNAGNDAQGNPIVLVSALACDDGSGSFSILWERNGDFIVCEDTDKLLCKAIRLISDPNKWTPGYAWAVAAKLASVIAGPITNSAKVEDDMMKKYEGEIKKARRLDGAQGSVLQQFKKTSTSIANRR